MPMTPTQTPEQLEFAKIFCANLSQADIAREGAETLFAAAGALWRFGKKRALGADL